MKSIGMHKESRGWCCKLTNERTSFVTCTGRNSMAGLPEESRAISNNFLCIRTSSALSAFTSSEHLKFHPKEFFSVASYRISIHENPQETKPFWLLWILTVTSHVLVEWLHFITQKRIEIKESRPKQFLDRNLNKEEEDY